MTDEELTEKYLHIEELARKWRAESNNRSIENLLDDAFVAGYDACEKEMNEKDGIGGLTK